MNPRYPYSPDMNTPTGIPRGYPYGPPPMPASNPMHPAYPSPGAMYSNSASPYPSGNSPYPSATPTYPGTSPYPSATPAYNSGTSPYPSTTPAYPSGTSPYPSSTPSYPSATPAYPSAGMQHPSSGSPYPPSGQSPYPTYPSGNVSGTTPSYPGAYPPANVTGQHTQSSVRSHLPNMAHLFVSEGTVRPYPNFDPKQDAEALRKAMKGFGTDEKAIINVLAKRSNEQRTYISVAFKQMYGKDLIDDLKSELKGNFEDVIVGLMTPTYDFLASELHSAMSGVGTDEDVLIEILCTRGNQEIWAINEAYRRLYGKNLEDDIKSDTSGHFQRLLVSTCTGARSENPPDEERAKQNAHALFAAGVGKWGTDESTFNAILVSESFHQLAITFYEYEKLAGHSVATAIDKEMSGDLKKGMLAIARSVENRPFYFAEKLYKAMKVGLGTDDRTLIRIVVSRCEVDMVQIKAEYERNYGKPLADAIHGDTSGDYRRVLIALVNGS